MKTVMKKIVLLFHKSTKVKMLIIYITSLLLAYIIIWSALTVYLFKPLENEQNQYLENYAEKIAADILTQRGYFEKTVIQLSYNYTVASYLNASHEKASEIWSAMTNIKYVLLGNMEIMPSIEKIEVYVRGSDLWTDGKYLFTQKFKDEKLDHSLEWIREKDNKKPVLCIYNAIRGVHGDKQAYVRLVIDPEKAFAKYAAIGDGSEGKAFLVDANDIILASSMPAVVGNTVQTVIPEDFIASEGNVKFKYKDDIAIKYSIDGKWFLIVTIPEVKLENKMRSAYVVTAIALLTITGVTGIILWSFLGRILGRINLLSHKMETIWDNKEEMVIGADCDELRRLEIQYNKILNRLDDAVNQMAEMKTQKQQIEIRALKSQINPHFLYNTLGTMRWKAMESNNNRLVGMIDNLTSFYRLSLNRGKSLLPMYQEVDLTKAYIAIQQERCDYCVEVNIEMDSLVRNVLIPKMTLQPLVENVWIHGNITSPEYCKLSIIIQQLKNGMVRLMIKDNGEGIPEERLLEIKERSDFKKDSCGFGISYNNDILHYYYGEHFKFEIESHPGEGTCVIMEIPVEISDRRLLE